ncbi:hypothetical protein [Flavobacterium reichenbachii]|uniref:Uncharacterized protein n=1 Tax=Flavobacterium reichenbachii TaxID=362418 RepID=A0A085ZJI6_9FLAO|nr:hypothetical protein [Flavobacterium reichenbachii]KFF04600.1 hypothetical protein IW19_03225 [Flavobacterium reichenbachii]OXB08821.1 hypothetical protein B0A68_24190 [Flavobacterium reichenbachii]
MTLTDKHIIYENDCRKMFVGQTILGIIYGEIKYYFEDINYNDTEPSYLTSYPDIDSLDHSVYFKTNNKTIYVFWDSTFFSYGLSSKEIDLIETPNDYEQKWDVSNEEKWITVIGQKIVDFKIEWEQVSTANMNGTNKKYYICPQTFTLKTENGTIIILSASEFKNSEQNTIFGMTDNLLVTTNTALAKQLKIIQ